MLSRLFAEMEYELISHSDNYKILDVLGEGGYGTVVACHKQDTNEVVAVKFLKKTRYSQYYDRREVSYFLMVFFFFFTKDIA